MRAEEVQQTLYKTIANISEKIIKGTDYLYIVEGAITEIDRLGNGYFFEYQGESYIGFSITGETYEVGDLVYILFSNNRNIKKMILSKTKNFTNNDVLNILKNNKKKLSELQKDIEEQKDEISKAISKVEVVYYISDSGKELLNGEWKNDLPSEIPAEKFIWTKTITYYSNGKIQESFPICITSGKSILRIEERYYNSSSNKELLGGDWSASPPTWAKDKYIWVKTVIFYSDGTEKETSPICSTGYHGEDGAGIVYKGDFSAEPSNPKKNWVYKNTTDNIVYIYNGEKWEVMTKDGEDSLNIYIHSSNGDTFKNTCISTILRVEITIGGESINDSIRMKERFGPQAKLLWEYKHPNELEWTPVSPTDPRLNDNGFLFTISTDDIDGHMIFNCKIDF